MLRGSLSCRSIYPYILPLRVCLGIVVLYEILPCPSCIRTYGGACSLGSDFLFPILLLRLLDCTDCNFCFLGLYLVCNSKRCFSGLVFSQLILSRNCEKKKRVGLCRLSFQLHSLALQTRSQLVSCGYLRTTELRTHLAFARCLY